MRRLACIVSLFAVLCDARLLPAKFSKDKKLVTLNLTLSSGAVVAFPRVEPLSFSPTARIFYIHNMLTDAECEHLIKRAEPDLHRSTVVDGKGGGVLNDIRTSAGTFLNRRSDPIISRINERLSIITLFPVENHEDLQILRYEVGQHYRCERVCVPSVLTLPHSSRILRVFVSEHPPGSPLLPLAPPNASSPAPSAPQSVADIRNFLTHLAVSR